MPGRNDYTLTRDESVERVRATDRQRIADLEREKSEAEKLADYNLDQLIAANSRTRNEWLDVQRTLIRRIARLVDVLAALRDDHKPALFNKSICFACSDDSPVPWPCDEYKRLDALLAEPGGIMTAERWCANCGREPIDDDQTECATCIQWFQDNPLPTTITVSIAEWDALMECATELRKALFAFPGGGAARQHVGEVLARLDAARQNGGAE